MSGRQVSSLIVAPLVCGLMLIGCSSSPASPAKAAIARTLHVSSLVATVTTTVLGPSTETLIYQSPDSVQTAVPTIPGGVVIFIGDTRYANVAGSLFGPPTRRLGPNTWDRQVLIGNGAATYNEVFGLLVTADHAVITGRGPTYQFTRSSTETGGGRVCTDETTGVLDVQDGWVLKASDTVKTSCVYAAHPPGLPPQSAPSGRPDVNAAVYTSLDAAPPVTAPPQSVLVGPPVGIGTS